MFKSIAQNDSSASFVIALTVLIATLGVAFANMATPHCGDLAQVDIVGAASGPAVSMSHDS